jgi:hypothetical protein
MVRAGARPIGLTLIWEVCCWTRISASAIRREDWAQTWRKAGIRTDEGRWHFLRFGPTAPLIPAAVFLLGMSIWIFGSDKEVISPSVRFCLLMMAVAGFTAFVISWMLWQLSNPPRSKSIPDRARACVRSTVVTRELSTDMRAHQCESRQAPRTQGVWVRRTGASGCPGSLTP